LSIETQKKDKRPKIKEKREFILPFRANPEP
jgi:hypothetical protein